MKDKSSQFATFMHICYRGIFDFPSSKPERGILCMPERDAEYEQK